MNLITCEMKYDNETSLVIVISYLQGYAEGRDKTGVSYMHNSFK